MTVRYFTERPGRDGKPRYFHQPSTPLRKQGWAVVRLSNNKTQAIIECETRNAALDAWRAGQQSLQQHGPSTVDGLIDFFKTTHRWRVLKPKSQMEYAKCLALISARFGGRSIKGVGRRDLRDMHRDMAATPAQANACMRVASVLFKCAIDEEWRQDNPAQHMGLTACAPRQAYWTQAEVMQLVHAAEQQGHSTFATACLLAFYLGQRPGDIRTLTWSCYQAERDCFRLRQSKTGVWVEVKSHPLITERLVCWDQTTPALLIDPHTGQPYTERDLRRVMETVKQRAGITHGLRFADFRRSAVVHMAEAGCSEAEIAAVTGHSFERTRQILETYLPRTTAMATSAMRKRMQMEQHV